MRFRGRFQFEVDPALARREGVRRFFHKWLEKLNDGDTKIGIGPISIDLRVEFEKRLAAMDDATLKEMVEDARRL